MVRSTSRRVPLAAVLALLLAGCATIPRERAASDIDATLAGRGVPPARWQKTPEAEQAQVSDLLEEPLTVERAVRLAFIRNPRIREAYAQLGFAQADVLDAVRLSNPTFGFVDLKPRGSGIGENHQITRSISQSVADLLLLPARSRLARGEFERVRQSVAATLLDLAIDVETTWYGYVSARQVATMRGNVAQAAASSAEFAQRSFDAGNLPPRDLALEQAAASEARVLATRALAEATQARTSLAGVLGISMAEDWDAPDSLPAPPPEDISRESLTDQALTARLDLAAARREVSILEDALGVTRRWRLLGGFDAGYERESETDGARVQGPAFALQLPLFNQGQGRVLRARADLESAQARLDALDLSVRNEVALGIDQLAAAHSVAETYRTALVPQREEVVKRELELYNFMLGGAFELIQAKRQEYDAYQAYLESVRDYWVACAQLRRAVGGQPVCESQEAVPPIGVEGIVAPGAENVEHMDHSKMDHSQMDHSKMDHSATGEHRSGGEGAKPPDEHADHPKAPPRENDDGELR